MMLLLSVLSFFFILHLSRTSHISISSWESSTFGDSCFVVNCKFLSICLSSCQGLAITFQDFFLSGFSGSWKAHWSPSRRNSSLDSGRTDLAWYLQEGIEQVSSATVFVCLCHLRPVATVGHVIGQTLEGGWGDWEHSGLRATPRNTA